MSETAYVCGIEGIPWPGRVQLENETLAVHRPIDESGKLFIPYFVPGIGLLTLQTCSLRQSNSEYLLPLELARGSCHRVRNQADQWQRSGLRLTDAYREAILLGTTRFIDAVLVQRNLEAATDMSHEALRHLETAANLLVDSYAEQALVYRKHNERRMGTLVGASVDCQSPPSKEADDLFRDAFNAVQLRMHWGNVESDLGQMNFEPFDKLVEWATEAHLRICAGPLFDFQTKLLPHWLYLYDDDFDSLTEAVTKFTTAIVSRYRGRVSVWNCVAGLNSPGPLKLKDEQVMRLTVAVLQAVRREDARTPMVVTVDEPWGEYLSGSPNGLSPLHFADILIRSDLGLSGIGLQLRPGYWPGGGLPRSLLDISTLIDRWALLGLPLLTQIAVPSNAESDPLASLVSTPLRNLPCTTEPADVWSKKLLRLLMAKHLVQGIFWDGWDDRLPHQLPGTGLINAQGFLRPMASTFIEMRKQFLC